MKKLTIIHDIYDHKKNVVIECDDFLECLKTEFKKYPNNARVYKNSWSKCNDITDQLLKDESKIQEFEEIVFVIYPSLTGFEIFAIVSAVFSVGLSIYSMLTMPKAQKANMESPNNELQARTNQARIGSRVPEIFGTVRSYPDLIGETYTRYNSDGIKVERSLFAITRGYVDILDMKDSLTPISEISGTRVSVYDPNTHIYGTPIWRSGAVFDDLPKEVIKSKSITGQALDYPEATRLESDKLYFTSDGKIKAKNSINLNIFENGERIKITGAIFETPSVLYSGTMQFDPANKIIIDTPIDVANYQNFQGLRLTGALVVIPDPLTLEPVAFDFSGQYVVSSITRTTMSGYYRYNVQLSSPNTINPAWNMLTTATSGAAGAQLNNNTSATNLDGTYTVSSASSTEIVLNDPELENPDWGDIASMTGGTTSAYTVNVTLDEISNKWVGWYSIEMDNAAEMTINLRFPNGLFKQNSKGGTSAAYNEIAIEYQEVDASGVPVGAVTRVEKRYDGKTRVPFGVTEVFELDYTRLRFRLCRIREEIATNIQAECLVEDVYLSRMSPKSIYSEATVIQAETVADSGALSMKERKLNCLVQRKLPLDGTGALTATNSAAQALIYLALDKYNGRRISSEIDIAQIKAVEASVIDYFDNTLASEFSYTIDDNNLSFEEIAGMIASTIFCESYRFGSKLRLMFEKPQENSTMLFNHTNKEPNTEKRTKTFGIENNYDGVEVEYTSPDDDTRITFVATNNSNPSNLKKIKTSGIRSHEQAKTRAWREWNKLRYSNLSVEFSAWEETNLLNRMDRILVADGTRVATIDGDIVAINGNVLTLSQPIPSLNYYTIFVQLPDKTVDNISCLAINEYQVRLNRLPLVNLSIGRATYQLISGSSATTQAFLVTELRPSGKMTNTVSCINYSDDYYAKDHDFF